MQPRIRTRFGRLGALALSLASLAAPLAACVESAPQPTYGGGQGGGGGTYQAPPPQQMAEPQALGLWKSNFGAVKIEEDLRTGTPGGGVLHGVWMYNRNGQDVIGYF